jgi:hypothetical protein
MFTSFDVVPTKQEAEPEFIEPEYDFSSNDIPIRTHLPATTNNIPEVSTSGARVLVQQSTRTTELVKRQNPLTTPIIVYPERLEGTHVTEKTLNLQRLDKTSRQREATKQQEAFSTEVEVIPSEGHEVAREVTHYHAPVRSDSKFY